MALACVAALALTACGQQPAVKGEPRVEVEHTADREATSGRLPVEATQQPASAPAGQVAIGDTRPLMDMVRDELPGHAAGPLRSDGSILARTYTPDDASVYDSATMTVRRFETAAAAKTEMDACGKRDGVRESERTRVAGVDALSYVAGPDLVLAIPDGPYLLELRLALASTQPAALRSARRAAIDVAETLLD